MTEERERLLNLIIDKMNQDMEGKDASIDYAAEYRKQTGKDLETGEYVTQ